MSSVVRGVAIVVTCLSATAHAEQPAWPVRANLSLPLGYTAGTDRLHGFTWGFRLAVNAYPTRRGLALGAYTEVLIDTLPRTMFSIGAAASTRVHTFGDAVDLRLGAYGGLRWSGERDDDDTRIVTGLQGSFELPFYLYDLRAGARVDATFTRGAWTATTIVFDVDVLALIAVFGRAYGGK